MTTIKDIAKIAHVSPATVSRILNGSKPVSADVRERVESAIKKTGFRPNNVARSLILKRSSTLGVLMTDISNIYYSKMIRGIEQAAYDNGYAIMLADSNFDHEMELKYLDLMQEKCVDGVIICTKEIPDQFDEFFRKSKMPVVFTNRKNPKYYTVSVDNYKMAYEAVTYLIDNGHEKIGCIYAHLEDLDSGLDRYEGYKKAMKERKLKRNPLLEAEGDFSIESGYNAMNKILTSTQDITAVFAACDEMAFGAISCIIDHNLKVPDDISVIGYDDIRYAEYFRPSLTTVHQPIYEIGVKSVQVLLNLVQKKEIEKRNLMDASLKIRDSVRMLSK